LIKAAIRDNNPVLYLQHKFLYRRIKGEVPDDDYVVPRGQAALRRVPQGRPGGVRVAAHGAMVWMALEAARQLAADY
jgi:2-oxoisovalerate dehydrogenase E1 component beta subunit